MVASFQAACRSGRRGRAASVVVLLFRDQQMDGRRLTSWRYKSSRSSVHRKCLSWRYSSSVSEACGLALCQLAIDVFDALCNGVHFAAYLYQLITDDPPNG
jgi:hypothetical protein